MILGLSLFAGGCSNDQIDDHIISLQDKISDVTASDSTEQEDQEPSLSPVSDNTTKKASRPASGSMSIFAVNSSTKHSWMTNSMTAVSQK